MDSILKNKIKEIAGGLALYLKTEHELHSGDKMSCDILDELSDIAEDNLRRLMDRFESRGEGIDDRS